MDLREALPAARVLGMVLVELELSALALVFFVLAFEVVLPALVELPGLGWGWVLPPPQSLEPAVPGFEIPAPALLELPLP